jgi:hypothetical protein
MKIVRANQNNEYVQRRYGELKRRQRVYKKDAGSKRDGKSKGVRARETGHDLSIAEFSRCAVR